MEPLGKIKLELLEILGGSLLESFWRITKPCWVQTKIYFKNKMEEIYNYEK